jgi:multiple sugar transport system substrate-binding protein
MLTAVSCSNNKNTDSEEQSDSVEEISVAPTEETTESTVFPDVSGQTIYWLADYDINPEENEERSTALALFEDMCGGSIEYIPVASSELLTTLESRILADEPVDMVMYNYDSLPYGVSKNLFQPLDDYYDTLGMDSELWDGMSDIIDMFAYNDEHYVIPYQLSSPALITYSRTIMKSEGLDDPRELWEKGEWNWDTMLDMMNNFVARTPEGYTRYGIQGEFGQALIQSSGHSVVNYENGTFTNNLYDTEVEKAENLLNQIYENNLYSSAWTEYFPDDHNTLFYAMSDWTLGLSNEKNADMDLMIVPFPTSPDSGEKYITCNYSAKMLAANSDKGDAVAAYIKCERIVAADSGYKAAAKEQAINQSGITEEQYDALQEYLDTDIVTPVYDFGYGMGKSMYTNGNYTYDTLGVMNKLENALLNYRNHVSTWEELRDSVKDTVDEQVKNLNK